MINSRNNRENWVEVNKVNETTYENDFIELNISTTTATYLAVIISIILALFVGAILLVGVVYAIISVYSQIIN